MCAPAGVRCVYEAESDTECEVMNSRGGGHGACRSCSVLCVRVCTSWPRCVAARGRRGAGAWARPVSGVGVRVARPGRAVPTVVRAQTELMLRILSRVCASLHAPTKTPLPHSEPACGTGAATMWAGLLNMFIDDCVLD